MRKQNLRAGALLLTLALLLSACSGTASSAAAGSAAGTTEAPAAQAAAGKDTVTLAMTSTWDTLMPYNSPSAYTDVIDSQIYDKLVYCNGDYSISPRLADSWTMSEDHTSMTFVLNANAKWHDGEPVTADDVVFTANLVTNPKIDASKRSNFIMLLGTDDGGAVQEGSKLGVEAKDSRTVTFTFKSASDPDTMLYQFCRYFYVLPKHILESKSPEELNDGSFWSQNPVGSGPFKYVSEISGERITLEANPDYQLGAPSFQNLIIRVVPATNLLAGLMSGEIDMVSGGGTGAIPLEDWDMAKQQANLSTVSLETFSYQFMTLNVQKEYLTQPVRQAICMAINRQGMVDGLLQGEGAVLTSMQMPPSHPYYDASIQQEYNPEKAKQMLEAENWDFSRDLEILVPSGNTIRERSAVLIQQDLAAIGVKSHITTVDFPTLMATMQRTDGCDLGLIGSAGGMDPDEGAGMFNPYGNLNFSNFPEGYDDFNKLYDQARSGTSREERKPIYSKIAALVVETGCKLYLYTPNALLAHNAKLTGADMASFSNLNWNTWEWKIED